MRVVAAVPGVQDGVGGDEHRQVAAVDAVEHLGAARRAQPLADDEAVLLELRQLLVVQAEVDTDATARLASSSGRG